MPCTFAPTNASAHFNNNVGNLSDKMSFEWQQAEGLYSAYGVPPGCIVRNTFLEWQEHILEGPTVGQKNDKIEVHQQNGGRRKMRRSRSCPELFLMLSSGSEETESEEATTPVLQRSQTTGMYPNSERYGATQANNSEDSPEEEEGWDGQHWSQNGRRTSHQYEDWKGSRSAKARRDSQGGKGKAAWGAVQNPLVLRGLPFTVTEAEVYAFLEEMGAKDWIAPNAVKLLTTQQGRPSGFAEIYLAKSAYYWEVQQKLHFQYFGNRYVEVLPPRAASAAGTPTAGGGYRHSNYGSRNFSWR